MQNAKKKKKKSIYAMLNIIKDKIHIENYFVQKRSI